MVLFMPGDGSTSLLAVTGRGEDGRVWGVLADRLAERYEVSAVLWDQVEPSARGRSFAAAVATSDGAGPAVCLAGSGAIRAVVLLAPAPGEILPEAGLDYEAVIAERLESFQWVHEVATIEDPAERRERLADGFAAMFSGRLPRPDVDRLREMYRDLGEIVFMGAAAGAPEPYADEIARVEVPVLVVGAAGDTPAAAIARALARRAPRGELVLLDTELAPYPWLAKPTEAADAVLEFLDRVL